MKIRCRILDNLKANGVLRLAGTEHTLDLPEADFQKLFEAGVIGRPHNPGSERGTDPFAPAGVPAAEGAGSATATRSAPEVMLIGSNVQPAEFDLSGTRYTLGELVFEAQGASGLPPEVWNELPDDEREAAIEATRIRIGAERLEFVEQSAGGAAASIAADVAIEAKPATVDVAIDARGGNVDPGSVIAAAAAAVESAKPGKKPK